MTAAEMIAYIKAADASSRASVARRDLPPGSSRAKVTTLNARWSSLAEERDRLASAMGPDGAEFVRVVQAALGAT
jgi:hypothetical protein